MHAASGSVSTDPGMLCGAVGHDITGSLMDTPDGVVQ
jgi:hypothetical protein